LVVTFSFPSTNASYSPGLHASIVQKDSSSLLVEVKLVNTLPNDLYVLSWNTPFNGMFQGECFLVTFNYSEVAFVGPKAKRGDPSREDYFLVEANGGEASVTVNLPRFYDFSLQEGNDGTYEATLAMSVLDVVSDPSQIPRNRSGFVGLGYDIISNSLVLNLDGKVLPTEDPVDDISLEGIDPAPAYLKCTSTQTTTVGTAYTNFGTMITDAASAAGGGGGAYYATWFGTSDSSRLAQVKKVVTAVNSARSKSTISFDCKPDLCEPGVFAYVFPADKSFVVHLCSAFWSSSSTGTWDSQAGTIVHELSHFDAIGGTDDIAYGTSAAKSLAKSNPNKAVLNADSYEYFSENQVIR